MYFDAFSRQNGSFIFPQNRCVQHQDFSLMSERLIILQEFQVSYYKSKNNIRFFET